MGKMRFLRENILASMILKVRDLLISQLGWDYLWIRFKYNLVEGFGKVDVLWFDGGTE